MIRAIIFDFDGVLVESANIKTEAFKELFADYPQKIEDITRYHLANAGISRYVKFRYIYEQILRKGLSKDKEAELGRHFSQIVLHKVLNAPFVAGAKDFLETHKSRYQFFIASGTPDDELCEIIKARGLQGYFKQIHGGAKGKIDIINDIINKYGFDRNEIVFIGDAESDRLAADKSGITFIGLKVNLDPKSGAYPWLISDLSNLSEILKRIEKTTFKILLVYANKMMENLVPINLSALSAVLKQKGFDVRLFDTTYYRTERVSGDQVRIENLQLRSFDLSKYGIHYKDTNMHEDFRKAVTENKPDIIGLSAVEDTYKMGISLLNCVKDLNIPVIVGGVHAIISPEEVIREDVVDMVCIGEGENSFVELCEKMHNGDDYSHVHGIWFKKNGKIIKNPPQSLTDINKLPYLDFTIYEKERLYRPMQGRVYQMLPIEISRGCPFMCTYCAAPTLRGIYKSSGTYFRKKKIKNVINEIMFYKKHYNLNYVYFTAETFLSLSDEEFAEFVSLYKQIKLPFWFQTRPETITEARIRVLEQINCDRITVGIEAGNERIRRKLLNRNISNEAILKAFDILARSSIPVSANNIIGIPDETREDIFDTINLNRAIKADSISVFIFTPYRGTKLRQYCIEKGYISADVYSADHRRTSVLNMPSISEEKIRGLLRTFPLYVKFPRADYTLIEKAERFDEKGNELFKQLSARYKKEYFN